MTIAFSRRRFLEKSGALLVGSLLPERFMKAKNFSGNAAIELAFPANYVPQKPLHEVWQLSREYVKNTFGW